MDYTWYIVNFFVCSVEAWIAISYFGSIFETKKISTSQFYGRLIALYGILYAFNVARLPVMNLLIATPITFLCVMVLFRGNWQSKVYYSFMWVLCGVGAEFIVAYALNVLVSHQPSASMSGTLVTYFGMTFSKLLLFVLLKLLVKFLVKGRQEITTRHLLTYLILPGFSLILMLETFYLTMDIVLSDFHKLMLFSCSMGIVIANVMVFDIFEKALRAEVQNKENALVKQEMRMAQQYTKLVEEKNYAHQVSIHDFKKHMAMIRGLAQADDCRAIIGYIAEHNGSLAKSDYVKITGNMGLDVLLCDKQQQAKELAIDFKVDYQPVDLSFVNNVSFSEILGNVLDNAVESCQRSQEKMINMRVGMKNKNYIVIMVLNSCSQVPEVKDGVFKTQKAGEGHGIGLKSARQTVTQYGGQMECVYLPEERQFKTTILIPTLTRINKSADLWSLPETTVILG